MCGQSMLCLLPLLGDSRFECRRADCAVGVVAGAVVRDTWVLKRRNRVSLPLAESDQS